MAAQVDTMKAAEIQISDGQIPWKSPWLDRWKKTCLLFDGLNSHFCDRKKFPHPVFSPSQTPPRLVRRFSPWNCSFQTLLLCQWPQKWQAFPVPFIKFYTYTYVYIYTVICLFICTYSKSMPLSIYRSIDLSVILSICLFIYPSIHPSIHRLIDLSIYRSMDLSTYRVMGHGSIDLSVYRSISLSIYLPIYTHTHIHIYTYTHMHIYMVHWNVYIHVWLKYLLWKMRMIIINQPDTRPLYFKIIHQPIIH